MAVCKEMKLQRDFLDYYTKRDASAFSYEMDIYMGDKVGYFRRAGVGRCFWLDTFLILSILHALYIRGVTGTHD